MRKTKKKQEKNLHVKMNPHGFIIKTKAAGVTSCPAVGWQVCFIVFTRPQCFLFELSCRRRSQRSCSWLCFCLFLLIEPTDRLSYQFSGILMHEMKDKTMKERRSGCQVIFTCRTESHWAASCWSSSLPKPFGDSKLKSCPTNRTCKTAKVWGCEPTWSWKPKFVMLSRVNTLLS